MILLGNILIGIGTILDSVIFFLLILYFLRFIISWVNPDPMNMFVQLITGATDPLLFWMRRWVRPIGMFDMAFFVVVLGLLFLRVALVQSIIDYGHIARASAPQVIGH